jgi:hypothetical protein
MTPDVHDEMIDEKKALIEKAKANGSEIMGRALLQPGVSLPGFSLFPDFRK